MESGKPYVRWWWLSGPFTEPGITSQLRWSKENGFGGVELAWVDPSWLDEPERSAPRPTFLGEEWSQLVAFAKGQAEELGLGCDFTFGSSWPFGGSWLQPSDTAKTFQGFSEQRLRSSWESAPAEQVYVLDHLSAAALQRYSEPLVEALGPALKGLPSALFCDSLEIATEQLWSPALWEEFSSTFGYPLEPYQVLDDHPDVRYDYRKLIGTAIRREFYEPFTELCHRHRAYSRVQCHGAPTDLLAAYAAVDVPESEALLFLPPFSRIAASAAAWAGKNIVSAEAFTCLHGFPGWDDSAEDLWMEEHPGDLKMLADALFANGVNQLVWHGMPYRPEGGSQEFYAAVHVGPDSPFAASLAGLNDYFTRVCRALREGAPYASVGVYLPNEDALMLNRISEHERTPGANYEWEMRHVFQPRELWGFAPVWISLAFLKEATCIEGSIMSRALRLDAIFIDVEWLDREAAAELERLHDAGAKIIWPRRPRQPGRNQSADYQSTLDRMIAGASTLTDIQPLLSSEEHPPYWARVVGGELVLFFAHPEAGNITYPMPHRMSQAAAARNVPITLRWNGHQLPLLLQFGANDGVLIRVSSSGLCVPIELPKAAQFGSYTAGTSE